MGDLQYRPLFSGFLTLQEFSGASFLFVPCHYSRAICCPDVMGHGPISLHFKMPIEPRWRDMAFRFIMLTISICLLPACPRRRQCCGRLCLESVRPRSACPLPLGRGRCLVYRTQQLPDRYFFLVTLGGVVLCSLPAHRLVDRKLSSSFRIRLLIYRM